MSAQALRGIAYMVLANGSITLNNALIKLVVVDLPPMQTMTMRAIGAVVFGLPLVMLLVPPGSLRHLLDPRVLARNVFECGAAITFVLAVATAPLADLTAILQLTPVLVLVGAVLLFGDRVGRLTPLLVVLAFAGALLVAQPVGGIAPYVALGLLSAVLSAGRDLFGRGVAASVPGLVVAIGVSVISIPGIGAASLVFEHWVMPSGQHLVLVLLAGLFLTLAQLLFFLAFRVAATATILPFFYGGTLWAIAIGFVFFGTWPNGLALLGMALIVASGVLVVVAERRK